MKQTQTDSMGTTNKKGVLRQTDIPGVSLEEALRVATAIKDSYAMKPATPVEIGLAIKVAPTSGHFRTLTGASVAYGLTSGGYNASEISLTDLGRRAVAPEEDNDDEKAKREAFEKPRIIKEFIIKYDGNKIPTHEIMKNTLFGMGVPYDAVERACKLLMNGLTQLGYIKDIKGNQYLQKPRLNEDRVSVSEDRIELAEENYSDSEEKPNVEAKKYRDEDTMASRGGVQKVFITHGKNLTFLEPIKKLLSFGGFESVVATEKQTISQPVPEKVMEAMRSCTAAIIHIDAEEKLIDSEAKEHLVLNPNVLIEIGAAMALYDKRFILLVKDGVQLPSNLQGLYEVRYLGDTLDSDVTIKLLEAINDIKGRGLPNF